MVGIGGVGSAEVIMHTSTCTHESTDTLPRLGIIFLLFFASFDACSRAGLCVFLFEPFDLGWGPPDSQLIKP
jgi:hypothetical protein